MFSREDGLRRGPLHPASQRRSAGAPRRLIGRGCAPACR